MKFDKGKTKDYYLFTTDVENVYINEYMTEAPGEYVKAYLYGLFCSEHGMELKSALMAEVLHMDEDRLREAWEYWERMNVVAIEEEEDDYTVVFLSLREQLFSGEQGVERAIDMSDEVMDEDEEFKRLTEAAEDMLGRPLNGRELQEIDSWTKELGVPGEVIHEAFDYCVEKVSVKDDLSSSLTVPSPLSASSIPESIRAKERFEVSFGADAMTVTFSQYEIACYASGIPTFEISYDKLVPFLNEYGRRLLRYSVI